MESPGAVAGGTTEVPMQIVGVWEGNLLIQGAQIAIVVKFFTNPADPDSVATLDIPAQAAYGLMLSNLEMDGSFVGAEAHFELAAGGPPLVFDGTVTDATSISGAFAQGPASGEFTLTRERDLERSELASVGILSDGSDDFEESGVATEVTVENAGVTLHGTLLMPLASEPVPVVIIVAGSGPTDRDGNNRISGRSDSLKLLAEGLARHGVASLRFDKRGIAQSAYDGYSDLDLRFVDYAGDLLTAVQWADARSDISGIHVAGHSEGGLIVLTALGGSRDTISALPGSLLAARELVSGVICIAAPGRPFDQIILEQYERQVGADSLMFAKVQEIVEGIVSGTEVTDVPQELLAAFRPSIIPYLRSMLTLDPTALAAATPQPLLVVGGVEDIQVPVSDAEALAAARPDARLAVIPGMNHVLKIVPEADMESNLRAYGDLSFELSVELVDAIAGFVLDQQRSRYSLPAF